MSRYEDICAQFYGNRLLFGDPDANGVVAIEIASRNEVKVIKRFGGRFQSERRPLQLIALPSDPGLMNGLPANHRITHLGGDFPLRFIAHFDSLDSLDDARRHLRRITGEPASAPDRSYLILADPVEQHLMLTGTTYFMGMQFRDLRRLQLDIETYISPGFEFPSAARAEDRIIAIALTDSDGFECVLSGKTLDEPAMLRELVRKVRERDPDVIEGHNLFRFDFEY